MTIAKRWHIVAVQVLCFLGALKCSNIEACCNISIPSGIKCSVELTDMPELNCSLLQRVFSDTAECVQTPKVNSKFGIAAEVLDYCGVALATYLGGRAFLKDKIPCIKRESCLQSRFQKILSSEWTALGMTILGGVAFINLARDTYVSSFLVSCFSGGVPALIGGLQFGFDVFKAARGTLRCFGLFLPSQRELNEERQLLTQYYSDQVNKYQDLLNKL